MQPAWECICRKTSNYSSAPVTAAIAITTKDVLYNTFPLVRVERLLRTLEYVADNVQMGWLRGRISSDMNETLFVVDTRRRLVCHTKYSIRISY